MNAAAAAQSAGPGPDAFRLRRFVERLEEAGELERVEARTDLIDVASCLDGNARAVLFEAAGPEQAEIVGNVMGGRGRLAMALGVEPDKLLQTVIERLRGSIAPVEVAAAEAPCQEVVWEGEDADFTRLPVHLQHELDGAPYISAGIDITCSLDGAKRNVGYRRIMLRGRREAGIDLVAPSDLRGMYAPFVQEDERMPMAFVVGSHPADGIAATSMTVHEDELGVMGSVRGAPVPLVKCVTIDAWVPADAEFVLEGYLDEKGWHEGEGPYGEYVGYYGHMKINPVFHLTAITKRRDALFQTLTIGGRHLDCTDTAQLCALRTEAAAWQALETAVRNPRAVYVTPSCGGMFNARICIEQNYPGEARNAISAVLGSKADVKHVFAVDPDIDIFSDQQMDWALATRFQADRDFIPTSGYRAVPLDPSLDGSRLGAKAGFDLTFPFGWNPETDYLVPEPPTIAAGTPCSVLEALQLGPRTFRDLMEAACSRDGREIVTALDDIRRTHGLERLDDGRYALSSGAQ